MAFFSFLGGTKDAEKLPDIFPIPIAQSLFVAIDVENIYARILTDVFERTQGIPDDKKTVLWDSCVASENRDGLVSMLSKALVAKKELFLVFTESTKVLVKASPSEEVEIRKGYETKAEPVKLADGKVGIYVTFKNYLKSDMVKFYSALEYCAIGGLWKQANISKSVQIKISELRGSVSLNDSSAAIAQAKAMADGMAEGRDVLTDSKDIIESLAPDMTATSATLELIAKKQSNYLGLPPSYFGSEKSVGLSDNGKGDSKKVEQGLKNYFFAIVKPVIDGLFGIKATFKSENAEGLESALKTLETMDRTSNEFLGADNKTLIVNKAFGLDEDEVGDGPEELPQVDPLTGLPMPKPAPGAAAGKPPAKPPPFPPK